MIIFNKLHINNIGVFKDSNTFHLKVDLNNNENIILFGGKNGTGKTTFIESIKICLYGNSYYGFSKSKYEKFIKEIIHKDKNIAEISIDFDYFKLGIKENYTVLRRWVLDKNIKEEFLIYKDQKVIENIGKNSWQLFINNLIPQGLINFFFFDGEKLENLAKELDSSSMVNDIKSLMGFNLIEQLQIYLKIIKTNKLQQNLDDKKLEETIKKLTNQIRLVDNEINKHYQLISALNTKLMREELILREQEELFIKEGGNLAKGYEKNKLEKENYLSKKEDIVNKIKDMASTFLPLLCAPELIKELVDQVNLEKEIRKNILQQKILKDKEVEILNLLNKKQILEDDLKNQIEQIFTLKDINKNLLIHDLGEKETEEINFIYNILVNDIKPKIKGLFNELNSINNKISEIDFYLQAKPNDDLIAPYLEKIAQTSQKIFNVKNEIEKLENEIKSKINDKTKLERELQKVETIVKQKYKEKTILSLIDKSDNVLNQFKNDFISKKLDILRREILEALSRLERKSDLICDIEIDNKTFEIKIYNNMRQQIPIERLSAGERQIFAISFLWGLVKTSGKSLPVVIDTPLGRLDSDHRENFAKNYFPSISHQVIILSTDKEVDKDLLSLMENNIAKSYTFEYLTSESFTKVKEGYFWKTKLNENVGITNEI